MAAGDIFRGTMGGISLTFVGHPFDTVKVSVYLCWRKYT
jgi:hypothetical protein